MGGPSVQLGGTAGAWAAPTGQAAVGRLEQALPDQLVEMEGGEGARDAQRPRRLVPAHVTTPARDVTIKTPPDRFVQRRDGCDLALEL